MNNYEAPHLTREPVIDFGSVSDFEKSILQKGKEGMQATLAYVFGVASTAVEKTFATAGDVTGGAFDTLSTVAPATTDPYPGSSFESSAHS